VDAGELARDLWWWTGRRDSIGADVTSYYYKTGRFVLLFDPLLPPEDPEGFWRALDRDVLPGDEVHVLVTRASHERSSEEMLGRYPGSRRWQQSDEAPAGVTGISAGRPDEVVFWIPEHRALVVGDALVGDGAGGLKASRPELVPGLRPLLELEPALVLVSHGGPVHGADALRGALAG
jgi:hypothetical protein